MLSNDRGRPPISQRFEKGLLHGSRNNDENSNAIRSRSSKSLVLGSKQNLTSSTSITSKKGSPGGDVSTIKRRALGDISNRKPIAFSNDGKAESSKIKPLDQNKSVLKKGSNKPKAFMENDKYTEPYQLSRSSRKLKSDLLNLPLKRQEDDEDDEETIELPAGRLYGEGNISTFFEPAVCLSFDLLDEEDHGNDWNAFATKLQAEREQEIRANDEWIEKSMEELYQQDMREFLTNHNTVNDPIKQLLHEEDTSNTDYLRCPPICWCDDDISL